MANIVLSNADIMNEIEQPFEVDGPTISMIFNKVNDVSDISDKRLRVIKKATILFCEIAHCQPFRNGNRTTAYYAGHVFLRRHGFQIPLASRADKKEIEDLLTTTKEIRVAGITEDKLCELIERYLISKVVAL